MLSEEKEWEDIPSPDVKIILKVPFGILDGMILF